MHNPSKSNANGIEAEDYRAACEELQQRLDFLMSGRKLYKERLVSGHGMGVI